jgi:Ca2+/Na+ antiporter
MENHPIMFAALIVVWAFYAMFYVVKVMVLVLIAIYKWVVKKIKKRREANNNVAN